MDAGSTRSPVVCSDIHQSRLHTGSDLKIFLTWCARQDLDPLRLGRVDIERYVRWFTGAPLLPALDRLPPVVGRRRLLPGLRRRPDPAVLTGGLRTPATGPARVTHPRSLVARLVLGVQFDPVDLLWSQIEVLAGRSLTTGVALRLGPGLEIDYSGFYRSLGAVAQVVAVAGRYLTGDLQDHGWDC